MKVISTPFPEVKLIEPTVFKDDRGHFFELHKETVYKEHDIGPFVQDNVSRSKKGVLRGLHFQNPNAQGKLVMVLEGSIFDVVVDVRVGSPMFGKWYGTTLTSDPPTQLWVPEGFAHGFLVTSERATVLYKCTSPYDPSAEFTVKWDDPRIDILWPNEPTSISAKDYAGLSIDLLRSTSKLPLIGA